ncbi:hypothetical protein OAX78_01410 [Planctomycetota bacterium]|nr:hypothetical protein [Planctomycetota bacterium]
MVQVEPQHAQGLGCVHEEQSVVLVHKPSNRGKVSPLARSQGNRRQRNSSNSPLCKDSREIVQLEPPVPRRKNFEPDPTRRKAPPRQQIGGHLVGMAHDSIARRPAQRTCNSADRVCRVEAERDLS